MLRPRWQHTQHCDRSTVLRACMLGTGKHVYVYKCVYASMNACHVAAQACNAERGATALQSRVPTAAGRFPRGQGSRCRQREAVPPGELEFWRVPGQGGLRVDDDFILRLPDPAGDHKNAPGLPKARGRRKSLERPWTAVGSSKRPATTVGGRENPIKVYEFQKPGVNL